MLNETTSGELLKHLHKVASGFETVSPEALKLRASCFDQAWSGSGFNPHIHLSFNLLSGRSDELRTRMAESLHQAVVGFFHDHQENLSVTVEVSELQTYIK